MLNLAFPETINAIATHPSESHLLFWAIKYVYAAMMFSTPFIRVFTTLSLALYLPCSSEEQFGEIRLPCTQSLEARRAIRRVGEIHQARNLSPLEAPRGLRFLTGDCLQNCDLRRGRNGKTTCCMYPFAKQLLGFRSLDKERRVGGSFLESKGLLLSRQRILEAAGRGEDYIGDQPRLPVRYNPLNNDLDAYALAYGIASLLTIYLAKEGTFLAAGLHQPREVHHPASQGPL